MGKLTTRTLVDLIRSSAHRLSNSATDWQPLLERIGDGKIVLLGEATHGTHEFYQARMEITQHLVQEHGFQAIAVEADWPDAYRINRYVRGLSKDQSAQEALGDFTRFPLWMWRNTEVVRLVEWLRAYNRELPAERRVGFYGLDLYSLHASVDLVLQYLEKIDPEAAREARRRYACFEDRTEDASEYGFRISRGFQASCEDEAVAQLIELRKRAADYLRRDGFVAEDELFFAEQNARLVVNAETYYRNMFRPQVNTWNLRDQHMADTLDSLVQHLNRRFAQTKVVVWEHNSHIGDARATERAKVDEWNVGQLVRQRYGQDAVLVGFTTYDGTVSCAGDWGLPVERKTVRSALPESYEALFHESELERFLLILEGDLAEALRAPRLERMIGVVYRPRSERLSHYLRCRLADQFDAVVHFDRTQALEPLDRTSQWEAIDAPESYPFGF